jgi:hypothetical protein
MKYFIGLFIFEFLSGLTAGVLFTYLNRSTAGVIAGAIFNTAGVVALWIFYKYSVRLKILNLIVTAVYMFVFSLPFWVMRLATSHDVAVVSVWGIEAAAFHKYSERMFSLVMILTVVQIYFSKTRRMI